MSQKCLCWHVDGGHAFKWAERRAVNLGNKLLVRFTSGERWKYERMINACRNSEKRLLMRLMHLMFMCTVNILYKGPLDNGISIHEDTNIMHFFYNYVSHRRKFYVLKMLDNANVIPSWRLLAASSVIIMTSYLRGERKMATILVYSWVRLPLLFLHE